jgi:hypothetical protein
MWRLIREYFSSSIQIQIKKSNISIAYPAFHEPLKADTF